MNLSQSVPNDLPIIFFGTYWKPNDDGLVKSPFSRHSGGGRSPEVLEITG